MTNSGVRTTRRTVVVLLVVGFLLVAFRATWYIAQVPQSNCRTRPITQLASVDPAFSATLLEKDCNSGETLFHLLTIRTPLGIIREMPLESDLMRPPAPTMQWGEPQQLEVEIPTATLAGTLTETWPKGPVLVRRFVSGAKEQ